MTHEPSAEERAAFARESRHDPRTQRRGAGRVRQGRQRLRGERRLPRGRAAAGVASLAISMRAGLDVFAAAAGPAVPVEMVQDFIGKVAAGLTEELRGHETRLRTDGGES